jgi:hypothetical protein
LDELFVRALYFEKGSERLLWLHCDLIGFDRNYVQSVREIIVKKFGFHPRQVMLSATHTHSGPATLSLRNCGQIDPEFLRYLKEQIIMAASQVQEGVVPVEIRFHEGHCSLGCDRRPVDTPMEADPRLPVLVFRTQTGQILALLANYAIHNVALSYANRMISADLAGYAAEYARQNIPGHPVVFLTCGAGGSTIPPESSAGSINVVRFGRLLGNKLCQAVKISRVANECHLDSLLMTCELPLERLSPDEVIQSYQGERDNAALNSRWQEALTTWRDETLDLLDTSFPWVVDCDLQVFQIGPVTWVGIGAEVFSTMSKEMSANTGSNTYIVSYANGNIGYLLPEDLYTQGGYEVELAHKFYGNFRVAQDGYAILRDRAIELVGEVRAKKVEKSRYKEI